MFFWTSRKRREAEAQPLIDSIITVRSVDEIVILDLHRGLYKHDEGEAVHKAIERLVGAGTKLILVNLEHCRGLAGAGLGGLVAGFNFAHARDCRVAVLNPPEKIQEVIRMIRLDTILQMFFNESEAVKTFTQRKTR